MKVVFIFFTALMWLDFIISFLSKSFNNFMIEELKNQNKKIDTRREYLKKLFVKIFKN